MWDDEKLVAFIGAVGLYFLIYYIFWTQERNMTSPMYPSGSFMLKGDIIFAPIHIFIMQKDRLGLIDMPLIADICSTLLMSVSPRTDYPKTFHR